MSDSVVLRNAGGDEAVVSLHGAHVMSWQPAGQPQQLYTSPLSQPAAGKALRGGVPVCFPQFASRGPLPKHGFARTSRWELVAASPPGAEGAEARLQLNSSTVQESWEHAFCLVLVARLGPAWMELELQAANTGRTAWEFTCALHTYLAVPDVRAVALHGLQGLAYEDMLASNAVRTEASPALRVTGEIDRVYRGVTRPLELQGPLPTRRILQQGFTDTVVWNPGAEKAAALGDMPAQDWPRMLCVEAAVVEHPVQLAPGETWRGLQRIELSR